MCNLTERFSFALNANWKRYGDSGCASPIGLNNIALLRDAPNKTDPDCSFLINQVGENGYGTLTATARLAEKTPAAGDPGASGINTQGGNGNNPKGHSVKTKLAIGLSISFFFITGLASTLYLLHRKKKLAQIAAAQKTDNAYERKEIDGNPVSGPAPLLEVPGKQYEAIELPAEKIIQEIHSPMSEEPEKQPQPEIVELPTEKVAHEIDSKEIKANQD